MLPEMMTAGHPRWGQRENHRRSCVDADQPFRPVASLLAVPRVARLALVKTVPCLVNSTRDGQQVVEGARWALPGGQNRFGVDRPALGHRLVANPAAEDSNRPVEEDGSSIEHRSAERTGRKRGPLDRMDATRFSPPRRTAGVKTSTPLMEVFSAAQAANSTQSANFSAHSEIGLNHPRSDKEVETSEAMAAAANVTPLWVGRVRLVAACGRHRSQSLLPWRQRIRGSDRRGPGGSFCIQLQR